MHPVAVHFAAGEAFFTGTAAILLALLLRLIIRSRRVIRWLRLVTVVGALLVLLSATPLPLWFYALWAVPVLGSVILDTRSKNARLCNAAHGCLWSALLLSVTALALELPYRFTNHTGEEQFATLMVIGDSVSAGSTGPEEYTWPERFRDTYGIEVIDVSHEGAKTRSAIKQAEQLGDRPGLVLIEIGGNDMFGGTSTGQFENDLHALLQLLQHPGRRLVMLELPLPPFYNEFGRIQRRQAARHGVTLIPRRRMMDVLGAEEATLDTVHLSEKGHALMAAMIYEEIGPLFAPVAQDCQP